MKIKTIALNLARVMCSSVLTAALVIAGTQMMQPSGETDEADGLFSFLAEKEKPAEVHYLEVKNQVITLKGSSAKERYLLLDLAYVASSQEEYKATEHNLPKLKNVLVMMFSGMDYDTVRTMSVDDIHLQMMARYEGAFGKNQPFTDVMISKMVFQ